MNRVLGGRMFNADVGADHDDEQKDADGVPEPPAVRGRLAALEELGNIEKRRL